MSHEHDRHDPDPQLVRRTFSLFPSGVVCVAAEVDGEVEGIIASSFTVGVSLEPPLASLAVQRTSTTWPSLLRASSLGVSILGRDQADLCRQIASKSREKRFEGAAHHRGQDGAVYLTGAPAWLECSVFATHPAGDHDLVVLEIHGLGADPDIDPLVFHRSGFPVLTTRDLD